jgi:hypothetical protein
MSCQPTPEERIVRLEMNEHNQWRQLLEISDLQSRVDKIEAVFEIAVALVGFALVAVTWYRVGQKNGLSEEEVDECEPSSSS